MSTVNYLKTFSAHLIRMQLSYLEKSDVACCSTLSRGWRALVDDDELLWKQLVERTFGPIPCLQGKYKELLEKLYSKASYCQVQITGRDDHGGARCKIDEERMYFVPYSSDSVVVIDKKSGKEIFTLLQLTNVVAIALEGAHLYVLMENGQVRVYEKENGRQTQNFSLKEQFYRHLVVDKERLYISHACRINGNWNESIQVLDKENNSELFRIHGLSYFQSLNLEDDLLIAYGNCRTLFCYNKTDGKLVRRHRFVDADIGGSEHTAIDRTHFYVSRILFQQGATTTIRPYNFRDGTTLPTVDLGVARHNGVFAVDGPHFIFGGNDVSIYNKQSGAHVRTLTDKSYGCMSGPATGQALTFAKGKLYWIGPGVHMYDFTAPSEDVWKEISGLATDLWGGVNSPHFVPWKKRILGMPDRERQRFYGKLYQEMTGKEAATPAEFCVAEDAFIGRNRPMAKIQEMTSAVDALYDSESLVESVVRFVANRVFGLPNAFVG